MVGSYERLSAQDRSFLVFDGPTTPMHVGAVTLLEAAPLRTADGGIDVARIRRHVAACLHWMPRYRQRIAYVPVFQYPVWVDDQDFDLDYHVRHVSLPLPGGDTQLKELAARIMSQPLDPSRPLWEMWVVEGLEQDRCALFIKTHHCVIDGASGVELLSVLMAPTPDAGAQELRPWLPRPVPTPAELLRDELARQGSLPWAALGQALQLLEQARVLPNRLAEAWDGLRETIAAAWQRPDTTPLNRPVGVARRCDWTGIDLAQVKEIKNRLGGTVNDVIVTTVTGALRRYLELRDVYVDDLRLRATVPVSLHATGEVGRSGNHVSAWLVELPIKERDPLRRFGAVRKRTAHMKRSSQARIIEVIADAAALVDPIHTLTLRLAAQLSPYNLIVTNIVGPGIPLYFLGARLLAGYPLGPLFHNQGLTVASCSYAGQLSFACNADRALVPDLENFTQALYDSFGELHAAATSESTRPGARQAAGADAKRPLRRPRRSRSRPTLIPTGDQVSVS